MRLVKHERPRGDGVASRGPPLRSLPTVPDADRPGAPYSSGELRSSLSTVAGDSAELWNPAGAAISIENAVKHQIRRPAVTAGIVTSDAKDHLGDVGSDPVRRQRLVPDAAQRPHRPSYPAGPLARRRAPYGLGHSAGLGRIVQHRLNGACDLICRDSSRRPQIRDRAGRGECGQRAGLVVGNTNRDRGRARQQRSRLITPPAPIARSASNVCSASCSQSSVTSVHARFRSSQHRQRGARDRDRVTTTRRVHRLRLGASGLRRGCATEKIIRTSVSQGAGKTKTPHEMPHAHFGGSIDAEYDPLHRVHHTGLEYFRIVWLRRGRPVTMAVLSADPRTSRHVRSRLRRSAT
jgi:hypothetical protein